MNNIEKNKLDNISLHSPYAAGVMPLAIQYCFHILKRFLKEKCSILEMGPAEGVMTQYLANMNMGQSLTLVEGSSLFCSNLKSRFPNVVVINTLFEEFETNETFDVIVMGHVLEHVEDPIGVITKFSLLLKPGGFIFAAVPNARSIHRQAAVIMDLLSAEDVLNEMDLRHGHRRVFNPESFRNVFIRSGLKIDIFGGYWLKPLSNSQIEKDWPLEILTAYMQLGERYPDIAGEIYVVASAANK
jgi:2-polyprenyl-3-methyl-5-hydroxy-6-metoxy-1,4-benzoquinol methylase